MFNILLISQHYYWKQLQSLISVVTSAIARSTVFLCQWGFFHSHRLYWFTIKKNSENSENGHISVGLQWFASIWWMSRSNTQREEWCDNRITHWRRGNFCQFIWIADGGRLHNSTKGRKTSQCFGLYIHTYIVLHIYGSVNEWVSVELNDLGIIICPRVYSHNSQYWFR